MRLRSKALDWVLGAVYILVMFGIAFWLFRTQPLAGLGFMGLALDQALIVWHDTRAGLNAPPPDWLRIARRGLLVISLTLIVLGMFTT